MANPDAERERYWAGVNPPPYGMERGYRPGDMDIHHNFYRGGHHRGFTPHWDGHIEGGPYQQHRNMHMYENYNNRRGAGNHQNFAPCGRGYPVGGSSRQSQQWMSSSKSAETTKNTELPANDVSQSRREGDEIHKWQEGGSANQNQEPDARQDETQTSRGENQNIGDKNALENQSKQQEQNNPHEQQQDDNGADSWKPLEGAFDSTVIKQEVVDMDIEEEPQKGDDKGGDKGDDKGGDKGDDKGGDKGDDNAEKEHEEEDDRAKAIEKLPTNHSRGLMSTLIGLIGPEAQNKKPDPLPTPRPMKLEDDSAKYLGPPKRSATQTSISEDMFLESGITSSMLAEANMEINYDERSLMPEDIGRDTSRPEFYCKLCQKQMTSLGNFRDHLNGKGHKSMLDAAKMGTRKVPKGKKKAMKSMSELGQKSVCLEMVEGATESILGLSFITEYHSITGVVCVCNLCAVKFDQNIVVSHTTGCKHRLRYMREKQPAYYVHLKKFGGKKSQLTTFLSDLAVQVEKDDGRGVPSIKVYHPERMDEEGDSLNNDEYVNRRLINEAVRHANVDDKDLENVDFQDWVNREMRRAKELYDSQKRSPSPGAGGWSTESIRSGRSPSVMSVRSRDFSRGDSQMSPRGSMFPHPHQPPPPPSSSFTFGRGFNPYGGGNSLPPQMTVPEPYGDTVSYMASPVFYRDVDKELDQNRHPMASRSQLPSNEKHKTIFDYGHRSKDRERDDTRPSRSGDRDNESPRKPARGRDERETITSRQLARGREDMREITSRQPARGREDERDITSRQPARGREVERDITLRQRARSREDERIVTLRQPARGRGDDRDITSRQPARGREDDRHEISTSKKFATSRADKFDVRDDITSSRQATTRSLVDERDGVNSSRQTARSHMERREVSTSVSRADKWEDDIQNILGHSGKKKLDGLALLSSTYSSPEERKSSSPPRQVRKAKPLPFSKTYMEILESQQRQKDRRVSSELDSGLLDSKRKSVRAEKFVVVRPKSRSPDVVRTRHRSAERYVDDRLSSQQMVHLAKRNAAQRVDSPEVVYLPQERSRGHIQSRSPVIVQRQQKRSRSPSDSSPVRTHKKPVATPSQSATDAEAERIANLLLELSSSLSGQEDPQIALQTLFSNADLTRALLSSKSSLTMGNPSREKSSGEKMHSSRSTEVGEPSGRHYTSVEKPARYMESPEDSRRYTSVEKPARYMESPEDSRRYAPNYPRNPETESYPSAHTLAMSQSSRAMPAAHSTRDRVAFSVAALKREDSIRRSSLMNFVDDSD